MLKQRILIAVLVVLLASPPIILVFLNMGPGRWANGIQDLVIGGHSFSLSFLAVLSVEFVLLAVVARLVLLLTGGRTLADLFTKKK